eukprot:TRINITY_DN14256_c0_g1_i2.p1 TRINITY_DN14256_c0_g1~~TRINITY_DN14256_c0_g1_i2.p1  ORF type:complete len:211 (+),score=-1.79 TRINITY_DN14256_c0_g1_i2:180-812(+)
MLLLGVLRELFKFWRLSEQRILLRKGRKEIKWQYLQGLQKLQFLNGKGLAYNLHGALKLYGCYSRFSIVQISRQFISFFRSKFQFSFIQRLAGDLAIIIQRVIWMFQKITKRPKKIPHQYGNNKKKVFYFKNSQFQLLFFDSFQRTNIIGFTTGCFVNLRIIFVMIKLFLRCFVLFQTRIVLINKSSKINSNFQNMLVSFSVFIGFYSIF